MAAHDPATVTIDTNEMLYVDQNNIASYVNNAETFQMTLAAGAGSSEKYTFPGNQTLNLADGRKIHIDADRSYFNVGADATAKVNPGSIWFEEDNGYQAEWKIRTVTIDDIDEPTALTMTLERVDNPVVTMTLTTVTVAQ